MALSYTPRTPATSQDDVLDALEDMMEVEQREKEGREADHGARASSDHGARASSARSRLQARQRIEIESLVPFWWFLIPTCSGASRR